MRVLSNCMMTAKSLCSGQKKAREMWFLARLYDAQQALDMGLVNTVVPLERLEEETLVWCIIVCVGSHLSAAFQVHFLKFDVDQSRMRAWILPMRTKRLAGRWLGVRSPDTVRLRAHPGACTGAGRCCATARQRCGC